ncbi:hypothetical protein [Microlunatus parietis]|uniref:Uncharacterized protein n=1 Tax=Microlunatus parietis TaxID=682979 RepID=A0A7Y9I727_9ACTN|nr:hypothetical protein [Microlunatus parietis]NYE70969.1 hypothetical protein [Microlunatus parietis]
MVYPSAPAEARAERPGPGRGWLAAVISCGVLIMAVQFLLAGAVATRLVTPAPSTYRLSDKAGRVSVELPKTWWEATAHNAGQVVSDDTGDWVVPDLEASSDTPRWLSVWVDRSWDQDTALARQHETFVADGCPDEACLTDAVTEIMIDGHRGLRQLAHFDDGHLAVLTTLDTGRWMIFVTADGPETAEGAAELITISDSLRLAG